MLLLSALVAMLSQAVFEFGPLWLVALAAPAVLFGPYWAALMSTLGLGGYLAAKLDLTRMPVVVGFAVLAPAVTVVLAVTRSVAAVVVAQVVLALLLAVVAIYAGRLLHDAVPSTIRAGVSSGAGTASWVLFLPFALALGWLGREQGVPRTGWLLTGGALLVGVLLVVSVRRARPVADRRRSRRPARWPVGSWSTWSPTCSTASWRPGGARASRPTWRTATGAPSTSGRSAPRSRRSAPCRRPRPRNPPSPTDLTDRVDAAATRTERPVGAENPARHATGTYSSRRPPSRSRRSGRMVAPEGGDAAGGRVLIRRPVRRRVVVLDALAQHGHRGWGPVIRRWSTHSRRRMPMKRSAIPFARYARTGLRSCECRRRRGTAAGAAVNLRCRARMRNRVWSAA